MPLISGGDGDVKKVFMTDAWLVDRYVGSTLWNWGRNYQGGLGDNSTTSRSSPVQTVGSATNWREVIHGAYHTIGLRTDRSLYTWGYNNFGQLGTQNVVHYSSPVTTNPSGVVYNDCSAGFYHTAAIKDDGSLWLWGYNADGELGANDRTNRSSMIQTVSAGYNWSSVACGFYHTVATKNDGSLWLWGLNDKGQLGDNSVDPKSSPVQTVSAGLTWVTVSAGRRHSAGIKSDGTLWLWGENNTGALGDNTRTGRSSPVQTVAGGTSWKYVSCGYDFTAAIKLDGSLWVWGYNFWGQLGTNDTTRYSSPVQTVSAGTNWKNVSCGGHFMCAVKTDGSLWSWGRNGYGQLGIGTSVGVISPVAIGALTTWKQVSAGYFKCGAVRNG